MDTEQCHNYYSILIIDGWIPSLSCDQNNFFLNVTGKNASRIIYSYIRSTYRMKIYVKHNNYGFFLHRADRSILAAQIILGQNPTTRAVNSTYIGWVGASTHLAQVYRHLHQAASRKMYLNGKIIL